jgi:hypothetical protein
MIRTEEFLTAEAKEREVGVEVMGSSQDAARLLSDEDR